MSFSRQGNSLSNSSKVLSSSRWSSNASTPYERRKGSEGLCLSTISNKVSLSGSVLSKPNEESLLQSADPSREVSQKISLDGDISMIDASPDVCKKNSNSQTTTY